MPSRMIADALFFGLTLGMAVLVLAGIAASARRAGRDDARSLVIEVALVLGGWLAVTAALALGGELANFAARPPRWPLVPLTAIVTGVLVSRTRTARALIASTPQHQLIGA